MYPLTDDGCVAYTSFKEWNTDEEIANAARLFYYDVDNLELYVGMLDEETKSPGLVRDYTLATRSPVP